MEVGFAGFHFFFLLAEDAFVKNNQDNRRLAMALIRKMPYDKP